MVEKYGEDFFYYPASFEKKDKDQHSRPVE